MASQSHYAIVLIGGIGVGKTTLAQLLAKHFDLRIVPEDFRDNADLKDQNKQTDLSSPHKAQMFFLQKRFEQMQLVLSGEFGRAVLFDRDFQQTRVFEEVLLAEKKVTPEEHVEFEKHFQLRNAQLARQMRDWKLVYVYLSASTATMTTRIQRRAREDPSREFELDYSASFLTTLDRATRDFVATQPNCAIVNAELALDAVLTSAITSIKPLI